MFKEYIYDKRSALGKRVDLFRSALSSYSFMSDPENQIFFLCGANRSYGVPSARRVEVKKFIESLSDKNKVIFAEEVFDELMSHSYAKNSLDVEHRLSEVADKIIIILESNSSFCELGAFACEGLRRKLIVVNSSHFRAEKSFINTGPIKALVEVESPVLWYPMSSDGIFNIDGIGRIFSGLSASVKSPRVRRYKVDPKSEIIAGSKNSLYLIHDLIMMIGPVTYSELIDFIVFCFGNSKYDHVKHGIGVLRACGFVCVSDSSGDRVYMSLQSRPFFKVPPSYYSLMASARRYHLGNGRCFA